MDRSRGPGAPANSPLSNSPGHARGGGLEMTGGHGALDQHSVAELEYRERRRDGEQCEEEHHHQESPRAHGAAPY